MEEAIAMGCRSLIAVGGAGALVTELVLGSTVVAEDAIRDEGTSHHYLPAGRLAQADADARTALEQALREADLPFIRGRTWTTDALYRETRTRVERRVAEGALTVEMEALALFAVASHRQVAIGQLLYAGDSLSHDRWDERGWTSATDLRRNLFQVALAAAVELELNRRPAR